MWQQIKARWSQYPVGREVVLAPLALLTLFLVAYREFFTGDRFIATFQDNTYLILPLFHHISESFSRGEFPYWANTLMAGLPLYDSPQFSITYPFYFFQAGLYTGPLDTMRSVHYVTAFHLFILYLNSYVLLRILRLNPLAAFLGASLLAFSANTFDYAVWVNTTAPYSWLPLAVASVVLVLEDRHAKAGVILGAFSLGLLALASTAQPLIHVLTVMGVLYAANAVRRWKSGETRTLRRATVHLAVMGVLALMLAAPAVFPVLADAPRMIRFLGDYSAVVGFAKIPFEAFLVGQLKPLELAGTLLPLDVHKVIGSSYVGLSAALLALLAVFKARAHWVVLPLLFITLYALLSSTGTHLGLARLNYYLPLINKIREPPRHLFLFVLGASTLAAFGFTYLCETLRRGYGGLLNLRVLSVVAVFIVLSAMSLMVDLPYAGSTPLVFLLGAFVGAVGLLLTLPLVKGWVGRVVATLAVLLIIHTSLQYPRHVPKLEWGDYFSAVNLNSHRTLEELAKLGDARDYRIIFHDDKLSSAFWSMNASYHQLRTFQAYMNPLPNAQFEEVYQRFNVRNYYPLLGAKYYLCDPCDEALLRDFSFQGEVNGYKLHVAPRVMPRYTVVNRIGGSYFSADDFYNKVNAGFDFTQEAYVGDLHVQMISGWLGEQTAPPKYVLRAEHSSLNDLALSVNTEARSVLILNEYFDKAWKAKVNGVAVKPFRVNLNQIGVLLERGGNLVEFEYYPTLFVRSLWLQRATFAGIVLYVLHLVISSRRSFFKLRGEPSAA